MKPSQPHISLPHILTTDFSFPIKNLLKRGGTLSPLMRGCIVFISEEGSKGS